MDDANDGRWDANDGVLGILELAWLEFFGSNFWHCWKFVVFSYFVFSNLSFNFVYFGNNLFG